MNYININDLDVIGEVKLIFEANLDLSKGKSNKSYSIKLPDTSRNNNALQGMFSSYIGRKVSYPAIYTVQGVTLTGVLLITDIERHLASGVFISGNGVVWQAMQDDNLSDIDLSEYDIELNKTNVLASESGYPMVVFDMTDRGAFKSGLNSIDITDRFPALNVKQLFTELFNYYGFYLNIEDNTGYFNQLYLLFTKSDEIRNDSEWLQDAAASAGGYGQNYEDSGTGTAFEVDAKMLFPTDEKDPGGNLTASVYTAPETGTYQFKIDYNLRFQRPTLATVANEAALIYYKKNGTTFYYEALLVDLSTEIYNEFTGILDSKPIELEAGDTFEAWVNFSGDITYSGTWTVDVTQGIGMKLTVIPSRWYGAGSTVQINSILHGLTVKDFISGACQLLNADLYYNEDENAVTLVVGQKQVAPVAEVECFNYTEALEDKTNTVIAFSTDKARPQPDKLVKIVGAKDTVTNDLKYSRTLIAPCSRLFSGTDVQIPVLWQAGDPFDFDQSDNPPEQKTQANLRILRKATAVSGSYALTYGGVLASNSETRSTVLQMQEVDIRSLHIQELATERKLIQCDARLDVSKLYDNTYFKNDVTLVDRRNGVTLLNGRIKRAEQLRVDWFKITLYPTAQEQIDPSQVDWFAPLDATNTTAPGGGSGAGGGTEPLPADMWRSSITGQIDGLTEKTTPVDADDFVIDDSAAGNSKKKVRWASIKATLKTYFDTIYGYWVKVTDGLKTIERVGIGADPVTNAGLKVVVTTGYGTISQSTSGRGVSGISSTSYGVEGFATSTGYGGYFYSEENYGMYAVSGDKEKAAYFAGKVTIDGTGTTVETLKIINPVDDGLKVLGGNYGVSAYTSGDSAIYGDNTSTNVGVTGVSAGGYGGYFSSTNADKALKVIGSATVNSDGKLYFGDYDTDGSWRITRSGNNLVLQRRESGSWVTKQTISA